MGMKEECKNYKTVVVEPIYGWGWIFTDTKDLSYLNSEERKIPFSHFDERLARKVKAISYDVPKAFSCEIDSFFYFKNELRGSVGKITEKDHEFTDYWTVFSTRNVGEYDFTDNPARYHIDIACEPPFGKWPEFACGLQIYSGMAYVYASIADIQKRHIRERQECRCYICLFPLKIL